MSRKEQMTTRREILLDMLARGWRKEYMAARFGMLPRNVTRLMRDEGMKHSLAPTEADRRYAKTGVRKTAMIEPSAEDIMRIFKMRLEGKQDTDIGRHFHVTRGCVQQSEAFMPEIAILKDMLREQKLARRKAMKRLHALGLTIQRIADLFEVPWHCAEQQINHAGHARYAKTHHLKRKAQSELAHQDEKEEKEIGRRLRETLKYNPLLREAWEELVG